MISFPPNHLLAEQLRLLHTNAATSFLATGLLGAMLLWVLPVDESRPSLIAWCVAVWLSVVAAIALASQVLTNRNQEARARTMARLTLCLYTFYGAVWGLLPWLALTPPEPLATALIICCLAGLIAGGMSFMSPVLAVFVGFATLLTLPTAVKLLLQPEPVYKVLGLCAGIFLATLMVQARAASRAFAKMIQLRFENVELVARLRDETEHAQAAHADAEQANLAKSKFLAAASHDLRQPMHAQGMFLEVLSRSELTQKQREVLSKARAAGTASGEMLNTLLDFSRIEAGVIVPQMQPFRLQPLLNELEIELAMLADAKGIVYRIRETQAMVLSDPALVELILRNFVSNAIRYTDSGGVLVGCRRRGHCMVVEVRDTGIGIAPEHQSEVFREFHQLGNPERDRRKGLGLGLAIAKGLAGTLGHELTLTSTPGRGSVFRLALPLTAQVASEKGATRASGGAHLLNLRVLVIDDDEFVRDAMRHLLLDWGAHCEVAESIDEALAAVCTPGGEPDLLISDYRLREHRTGAEAIAAVRAAIGRDVPALLITGDTAPERLREARQSAVRLLHKPVVPAELYIAIMELLD